MPTYGYECEACGHGFEAFQSMSEEAIRKCPKCGKKKVKRLIGRGGAVIFKGSGFYSTDYRSEDYKNRAKAEKGASSGSGEAAKGDKKARWLIPAFLVVPAALAFRRFGPETLWNSFLVEPTAVAAFSVIVLLMLVKKVADTFEAAEDLSDYVEAVSRSVKSFIPKEFLENLVNEFI